MNSTCDMIIGLVVQRRRVQTRLVTRMRAIDDHTHPVHLRNDLLDPSSVTPSLDAIVVRHVMPAAIGVVLVVT